jgi:L-lactate dehydrogenase complex protein LldG
VASREDLLAALRRNAPREVPLPDLSALGVSFPDPAAHYQVALAAVGGTCLRVADVAAADRALRGLDAWRSARRTVSLVAGVGEAPEPGVGDRRVDLSALRAPRDLEGLDFAVLAGELAVAENGAVWVDAARLPERALFVITEHLALVVPAGEVVSDLHQAYARLGARPAEYGLFIAGPSKTADIEQALVIGAQGARSCTVLLVG